MQEAQLTTYLRDHLAGSIAGIQLSKACLEQNRDSELGIFMSRFLAELRQEREILKTVTRRLGGSEPLLKETLAWLGEAVGRQGLKKYFTKYSDLTRLMELEALLSAVNAKLDMWTVLETLFSGDERFSDIDFTALRKLAERQVAGIRKHCVLAAGEAFV